MKPLLQEHFITCVLKRQGLCVAWLAWNILYRPSWPQSHRDPPASASVMLALQMCTPRPACLPDEIFVHVGASHRPGIKYLTFITSGNEIFPLNISKS